MGSELMQKLKESLDFIAYRGQHSGIIPCPQDYAYYVKPMQDEAKKALDRIESNPASPGIEFPEEWVTDKGIAHILKTARAPRLKAAMGELLT